MKLLLRRSQKKGLVGSITFILDARSELTPEEKENVKKYRMGKEILYYKEKVDTSRSDPDSWSGIARSLAARARSTSKSRSTMW